ncbi:MAG: bile acid:sodium symporter [Micavibrio sp.]|nr:bile acid:sodium symporter [Micavibrio sp.]
MKRFLPDTFTLMLLTTVALASVFPLAGAGVDYFRLATKIAIGLLFFLHGARLSRDVMMKGLLHWRLHLAILSSTFVLFPVLGLLIGLLPGSFLPPTLYTGILYLCVLPSTVQSSIAFTSMAQGNVPASIVAASGSNLIGMFLTPLLAGLLLSVGGHGGFNAGALEDIAVQLLAPFLLGQFLQPWIGDFIRARKNLLMPVDRGSILMVVYLAFSESVTQGLWHMLSLRDIGVVVTVDISLLMAVLVITTFASRWLGFSREDEISIVFCGSKKSLASGVPMANAIFAGQAIGGIVLPLMLFHQIQLMVCAVLAKRYLARGKGENAAERLNGA